MEKIGVDRLSTGLSNCGSVFVFNKTSRGVGSVAEGRRQRTGAQGAPIAEIAVIARDRRDRRGKTLPLIKTDYIDQEIGFGKA
jgi:hypothetical protein